MNRFLVETGYRLDDGAQHAANAARTRQARASAGMVPLPGMSLEELR